MITTVKFRGGLMDGQVLEYQDLPANADDQPATIETTTPAGITQRYTLFQLGDFSQITFAFFEDDLEVLGATYDYSGGADPYEIALATNAIIRDLLHQCDERGLKLEPESLRFGPYQKHGDVPGQISVTALAFTRGGTSRKE